MEIRWTPLHLDFVVDDLDAAIRRLESLGGRREEIRQEVYGKLALMSDPFGHGFCLLEFRGRGYGELVRRLGRGQLFCSLGDNPW